MTSSGLRHSIFVCAVLTILAMPVVGHAQEATVTGTVTDTTGGVLPGVTIKAVNEASGNSFEAVTDARGAYRLAVRIGSYQITATLAGFGTVSRSLELQVGQTTVVNLQLAPSTVQENVTVTGEAPLIATTTSSVSGNIDPRQMSELPVLGRNWMSLSSAGAREPDEHAGLRSGAGQTCWRRQGIRAQRRRSAGDGGPWNRQPGPVQQRLDRGISVHLEPVRRDAGPVVRRAGERDHQIGHQQALGIVCRQLPGQQIQQSRSRAARRGSVFGPAVVRDLRRSDPQGQGALLRELRLRAPAVNLHLEHAVSRLQHF